MPKSSENRPVIAVLGATGAVGREALRILEERRLPPEQLRLFASARSAGKTLPYRGEGLPVKEASEESLRSCGADLVLGMTSAAVARRFAPAITGSGAVFVDNSSAFRENLEVPLVIPAVNPGAIAAHRGILSVPNCTTVITLTAVAPIHRLSPVESMIVSSYQAVSGSGEKGIAQLRDEEKALAEGRPLPPPAAYAHQIAGNLLPQIGEPLPDGFTSEEAKMQREGRKILQTEALTVNCTCVRVPILRCHSVSVTLRTAAPLPLTAVREALISAPGVRFFEGENYPMPLLAAGQDDVLVGRLRADPTDPRGISFFCCGDQLRRGAAATAVEIGALALSSR